MKILIVSVCYNNFDDAFDYIFSISKTHMKTEKEIEVDCYIVNNGERFSLTQVKHLSSFDNITVKIIDNKNNGYFGGCLVGYNAAKATRKIYDIFIVSNVDLTVDTDFCLALKDVFEAYGDKPVIIAPSIMSLAENKDRNPKIKSRYSLKDMNKFRLLYTIPYLHVLYKKTFYKNKVIKLLADASPIYAPHGSFMIFMKGREHWGKYLDYPIFLFGEEIFVGELAFLFDIPVYYHSNIKVLDTDHASTSLQHESFLRKNNLAAIQYLINRFWS